MSQTLVLSVGSDPVILDTRDLLLRSAGYIVVSAMSLKETVDVFQDGDFDLIVLCHTLSQKDCERLTCFIRASGSRIPIASVMGTLGEYNPYADAILEKEPAAFLAGIRDLLSKQVQMRLTGFSVPHNSGKVASAKTAPRYGTGIERQMKGTQDRDGTLSSLDSARERAPSR